ncbi:integral membrane protein terc family protein [Leptolyngbya sp. NIES-3755]|nr:integral membrane protein terc family protein [Leptolyngbya sp. NIES-3755]
MIDIDLPAQFSPQTFLLLLVLVALECVLSADNAIALAAITQGLQNPKLERRALNIGLVFAYVLRMSLILAASWVIGYWQFELAGALYLLWLVFQHFKPSSEDEEGVHHGPRFASLWQAIPVIALTDLAFSLDSVTTAIAVSQDTWLILLGGTIGIVALRFMAGLFIVWLEEFTHLEDAGYVTVSFVGLRLLLRVFNDQLVPPEWLMITMVAIVFAWGFSKRNDMAEVSAIAESQNESMPEIEPVSEKDPV